MTIRRSLPLACALAALLTACRAPAPTPDPDASPDVVLVMVDALRADHVGAYGHGGGTTPTLDRLAGEGALFEVARANCSWTRPSMASALSGLPPRETGVHDERSYDLLPDDMVLLSERFQGAGYTTAGVTANPNLNPVFGFEQGFDHYVGSDAVWSWMRGGEPSRTRLLDADDVTDAALKLARNADGPLYLQVVYLEPHTPLHPPPRFEKRFVADGLAGEARELALYDAEIAFADAELQRLLDGLAEAGRPDPLVVVFGDHGEGLFDHPDVPFSREHGYVLYESNLRVPWIVHHSSLAAGTRAPDPVELLDLTPTVLALAGLDVPGELPGLSHAGELRGGVPADRPTFFVAETRRAHTDKSAIIAGRRKLIDNRDRDKLHLAGSEALAHDVRRHLLSTGNLERYDLATLDRDGLTERPRLTQAARDTTFATLQQKLEDWELAHPPRAAVRPDEAALDPATLEQLRALGYLD